MLIVPSMAEINARAVQLGSGAPDGRRLYADLANGFANGRSGQPRIPLDRAVTRDRCEQACPTTTDLSGRP
jgi:hypothetical protein